MKANELMIGDWVEFETLTHKFLYGRIIGIDVDSSYMIKTLNSSEYVSMNKVRPIPITPKFLEKNGFILDEYGYVLKLDNCENNYINVTFRKNREVRDVCIEIMHFGEILTKTIRYVHQLQNALRVMDRGDVADFKRL